MTNTQAQHPAANPMLPLPHRQLRGVRNSETPTAHVKEMDVHNHIVEAFPPQRSSRTEFCCDHS
jgi:hypothetical protein